MALTLNVSQASASLNQFANEEMGLKYLTPDAHIALQMAPETWPLYTAMRVGYGDPAINSHALRNRAHALVETLRKVQGSQNGNLNLKAIFEDFSKTPPHLLDAVVRGAIPEYASNECPIALGGLFTFADNRRAIIETDTGFMIAEGRRVLPLTMPVFYHESGKALIQWPLKQRWRDMETYYELWRQNSVLEALENPLSISYTKSSERNGFSVLHPGSKAHVSVDKTQKRFRVDLLAPSYDDYESISNNHYAARGKTWYASQTGMHYAHNPETDLPELHRRKSHQETEINIDNLFLHPQKPNFLFMMGAVWMIQGASFDINNLPFTMLGNLVTHATTELYNKHGKHLKYSLGPSENFNEFIPEGKRKPSVAEVHLDRKAAPDIPQQLPIEWVIKDDQSFRIVSVSVNANTVHQTLAWMTRESGI